MDKRIIKAANDRTVLIETVINIVEQKVTIAERALFTSIIEEIVDKMDRDGNKIKNTLRNKRLFLVVDEVFTNLAAGKGLEVAKAVVDGISRIMDFNGKYYGVFTEKAQLAPIQDSVKETLRDWLGLTDTGKAKPNGYLDTLINDPRLKNQIKDITVKTVINQAGYNETKTNIKKFLIGNEESGELGAMKKYYRNFVYDTFSTVDRTNAKLYADGLKLNYAIYEGGLIETSRKFCKDRNGKVFTREEISKFDPKEAKPPNYNPFTDLGGYACRHHLNWVPYALAKALRPDLQEEK